MVCAFRSEERQSRSTPITRQRDIEILLTVYNSAASLRTPRLASHLFSSLRQAGAYRYPRGRTGVTLRRISLPLCRSQRPLRLARLRPEKRRRHAIPLCAFHWMAVVLPAAVAVKDPRRRRDIVAELRQHDAARCMLRGDLRRRRRQLSARCSVIALCDVDFHPPC